MKTAYLIYKEVNGIRQLCPATREEWDAILKENRSLPSEQRRRFMRDCFEDGDDLDCMYIEVSAPAHRKWNSENTMHQHRRKKGKQYTMLSLDTSAPGAETDTLHEYIPSGFDLERMVTDAVLMAELKKALRLWKPWAEELLDLYMAGQKRSCTQTLCQKYQRTDRAVQKRKAAFEKFILDFLKK